MTRNHDIIRHLEGVHRLFEKENAADIQLISPIQHLCDVHCELSETISNHTVKTISNGKKCLIG